MMKTSLIFLAAVAAVVIETTTALSPSYLSIERQLLSKEDCETIIGKVNEVGFTSATEDIDEGDENPIDAQVVDVVWDGDVEEEDLYDALKPYLDKITNVVAETKSQTFEAYTIPHLDEVTIRKFDAQSERSFLKLHKNSQSLISITIALNDLTNSFFVLKNQKAKRKQKQPGSPPPAAKLLTNEFISKTLASGTNTSQFEFPLLNTGDAILYGNNMYKGVAPVPPGSYYFLEMRFDVGTFSFPKEKRWYQDLDIIVESFVDDVEDIDIYWIDGNQKSVNVVEGLESRDPTVLDTAVGHVFQLVNPNTKEIMKTIVVDGTKTNFMVGQPQKDDLQVLSLDEFMGDVELEGDFEADVVEVIEYKNEYPAYVEQEQPNIDRRRKLMEDKPELVEAAPKYYKQPGDGHGGIMEDEDDDDDEDEDFDRDFGEDGGDFDDEDEDEDLEDEDLEDEDLEDDEDGFEDEF